MSTPRRTPDQVAAAARAMDRARAAGLPDELLLVLLAARDAWWHGEPWPSDHDLMRLVGHPASKAVDETLWRVMRRRLP
jgi:hypothetical protein